MRKSVLITGCTTGGVGHALAKEYQSRGLLVFATARRLESMEDLKDLPGVILIPLDVTNEASIQDAVLQVERHLEKENQSRGLSKENERIKLDILINNAGTTSILPFADTPISLDRRIIETNLIGPMSVTKAFLPLLMKSGDACVVCTGSISGVIPAVGSAYNASKAALRSWCDTLRMELAPFNIHVLHLVMGIINTNIYGHIHEPLPSSSRYLPIEDSFIKRRQRTQNNAVNVTDFARQAVDVSLKKNPPREAFLGGGAVTSIWGQRIVPRWLMESVLSYATGLYHLANWRRRGGASGDSNEIEARPQLGPKGLMDFFVRLVFV